MAHELIQQQISNTNIQTIFTTQNENSLSISYSNDNQLFFYHPKYTYLSELFQQFISDSQLILNEFSNISNLLLPLDQYDIEKQINNNNYSEIESLITEDINNIELNNISATIITDNLDENILLNETSLLNSNHQFNNQKQCLSITEISSSTNEIQLKEIALIELLNNNNNNNNQINIQEEIFEDINKNLSGILREKKQEKIIHLSNQLQQGPLKYRPYRQTCLLPTSNNTSEVCIQNETCNHTTSSSSISTSKIVSISSTNQKKLISILKHINLVQSTKKKLVHFADSVGSKLTQIQYIQSLNDDDEKLNEFSNIKKDLYLSSTSNVEHKPWSFDVVISSKQVSNKLLPKKFYCLYRQPNSEQANIYLNEILKSQIKLEHADIFLKSSLTNEQYLYGTLWVTNINYLKNVTIKYTFNHWLNTYEYQAQHCYHSNDFRNIDQFKFSIDIPHDVNRIDFILRYYVNGQEYWDNNQGRNYTLETQSASIPLITISLPHDCDFNEMRFY